MDFNKIIDSSLHDKLSSVGVSGEGSLFLNNPINRDIQLEYLKGELLKYNPSSVLEIGTHKAYFCYYCCYVLPQVKIITIDLAPWSKTAVDIVNNIFANRIDFRHGSSHDIVKTITDPIDLAWVDGYHDFNATFADIKDCIDIGVDTILVDDSTSDDSKRAIDNALLLHPEYKILNKSMDDRVITTISRRA